MTNLPVGAQFCVCDERGDREGVARIDETGHDPAAGPVYRRVGRTVMSDDEEQRAPLDRKRDAGAERAGGSRIAAASSVFAMSIRCTNVHDFALAEHLTAR